jgi:hypothetical protein
MVVWFSERSGLSCEVAGESCSDDLHGLPAWQRILFAGLAKGFAAPQTVPNNIGNLVLPLRIVCSEKSCFHA